MRKTIILIFYLIFVLNGIFAQQDKVNKIYEDVFFVDSQKGWIVASAEFILRTVNGGASWDTTYFDDVDYLNDVYFQDENIGYAVGNFSGYYGEKVILKTTDGGDNWLNIAPANIESIFLEQIFF